MNRHQRARAIRAEWAAEQRDKREHPERYLNQDKPPEFPLVRRWQTFLGWHSDPQFWRECYVLVLAGLAILYFFALATVAYDSLVSVVHHHQAWLAPAGLLLIPLGMGVAGGGSMFERSQKEADGSWSRPRPVLANFLGVVGLTMMASGFLLLRGARG